MTTSALNLMQSFAMEQEKTGEEPSSALFCILQAGDS